MSPTTETHRLVIHRTLAAAPGEVFAAWTDADSLRHWMCPGDVREARARLDVRVGGAFEIVMVGPTASCEHRGEYLVVDPPRKLVFTWISAGTGWRPSQVTVELREAPGGTELTLTHERLPSADAARRHESGWGQIVERLAAKLTR